MTTTSRRKTLKTKFNFYVLLSSLFCLVSSKNILLKTSSFLYFDYSLKANG